MTERIRCLRCQRPIDQWASVCPFCNWNQAQPAPREEFAAAPLLESQYVPPDDARVKKTILFGVGAVVMLIASFAIGMLINRDGAPKRAPESLEEQAAEHNIDNLKPKRADTPLVPAGLGGLEQPITSAPAEVPTGSVADDYQRTDATAVSAEEYARMAKRAEAETKRKMADLVDPRSISGAAYAQGRQSPVRRPSQGSVARVARSGGVRTRPVPEFQPLPPVRGGGRGRFTMIVGADGRVKDVSVDRAVTGNTAAVVSAIQRWRFKPATENGQPIAAPYSVEISFRRE